MILDFKLKTKMSSNTDGEFTSKKTNKKKSLQKQEHDDGGDVNKSLLLNHQKTSKNRRKTINIVTNEAQEVKPNVSSNVAEIKKTWRRGTIVEARDLHDNWYKSRIIEADEGNKRVKVHFFGWNSRYDQWFDISSSDVRPFGAMAKSQNNEKVSPLVADLEENVQQFNIGDVILAKWIDNFDYPATVTRCMKKNETVYYEVKFEDGVKKMIRFNNCKVYDRQNDVVSVKPAAEEKMVITEPPAPPPVGVETVAPVVEEIQKSDEEIGNKDVRKSGRVKRPRTLSSDEISLLFPIRRQSSGNSKKRKTNEGEEESPKIVHPQAPPLPPVSPQPQQQPVLVKEKIKKAPLGDYLKTLALFNKNKKRNKELSTSQEELEPSKEASNDVKFQVNINNQNRSSIKLKISKLTTTLEPNEIRSFPLLKQQQQQISASPIEKQIRCKFSNCDKTFRKQHLLDYHIKYHHYEDGRIIEVVCKKRKLTDNSLDNSLNLKKKSSKIEDKMERNSESSGDDPYEVIHCKCDKNTSVGFMIQCDICLCWQHGDCIEIRSDNAPKNYICWVCQGFENKNKKNRKKFVDNGGESIEQNKLLDDCSQHYSQLNLLIYSIDCKISYLRKMKDKNNENYKSILLNCENLQNSFEEEIEKLSLKLEKLKNKYGIDGKIVFQTQNGNNFEKTVVET